MNAAQPADGDRAQQGNWDARLLAATGRDAPPLAAAKLRSLRRLLLCALALEAWYVRGYEPYADAPLGFGAAALAATACAAAGWHDRFARPAVVASGLVLAGVVAAAFPSNANHQFLALVVLGMLALQRGPGDAVDVDLAAALRWLPAIGLFWAGVWKVWYGYWWQGEFLALRIASDADFARVLGPFVGEAERARLLVAGDGVGAGPFRADAPLLVAASNATWLAELALPVMLCTPATRTFAWIASAALVVGIQLAAGEVFFAGTMVGLLAGYARSDAIARVLPFVLVAELLWVVRAGILH